MSNLAGSFQKAERLNWAKPQTRLSDYQDQRFDPDEQIESFFVSCELSKQNAMKGRALLVSWQKRISVNSGINLLGVLVPLGITYFLTPYMLNVLGDYRYGVWASINSFFGYFLLIDLGMGGAIRRFVAQALGRANSREIRDILANAVYLYIVMALIVIVAGASVTPYLPGRLLFVTGYEKEIVTTSYLIVITVALALLSQPFSGTLVAFQRFDLQVSARTGQLLLQTILIVVAFEFVGWSKLEAVAVSYVLSGITMLVLVFVLVNNYCVRIRLTSNGVNRDLLKKIMNFSWMSSIIGIGDMLVTNSGAILIAAVIGPSQVARYAVPLAVASQIPRFAAIVTQAVGPEVSRLAGNHNVQGIKEIYHHTTVLLNCLTIPVWGISVVLSPEFFQLWLGQERGDYWLIYSVCATATASRAMQSSSYHTLMGAGRILGQSIASIVAAVIGITFSYLLLAQSYSILYAAAALLLPSAVRDAIIMPSSVCRQFNISATRLFFKGFLVPVMVTAGIAILLTGTKRIVSIDSMVRVVALGGVGFFLAVVGSVIVADRAFCIQTINAVKLGFRRSRNG